MTHQTDPARPWKLATAVLAVACAGLLMFIVMRSSDRIDPSVAASKVATSKKAPVEPPRYGPAAVSLRKFDGPEELVGEAKKAMQSHLEKAGNLTYKAAGVKSISIDTRILDRSKVSAEDTEVNVNVQLLVIKQPSNSLLGILSASAAAGLGAGASENFVSRTKVSVMKAAAESTFNDLVAMLKSPPTLEDSDDEDDEE